MIGVNKCEFIGHVGKFIEFKTLFKGTPNEQVVGKFSICTSVPAGGGKTYDDWHQIVVYGDIAKAIQSHLKQGRLVRVDAAHRARKVTNDAGITNTYHEFVVGGPTSSFLFLDSPAEKKADQEVSAADKASEDEAYAAAMIPGYKPQQQAKPKSEKTQTSFPDDDRSMPLSEMEAAGAIPGEAGSGSAVTTPAPAEETPAPAEAENKAGKKGK